MGYCALHNAQCAVVGEMIKHLHFLTLEIQRSCAQGVDKVVERVVELLMSFDGFLLPA